MSTNSITIYRSPIPNGDYLGVVNITADTIPVPTATELTPETPHCTILILDTSGSMGVQGDFVNRITNTILPQVFKQHNFPSTETVHLITFASSVHTYTHKVSEFGVLPYRGHGGTRMHGVFKDLQTILEQQKPGTFVRLLTISDGDIQDQPDSCRAATELADRIKTHMNLSIDSTAIRLFTSQNGSPSTVALASILQLNSTPSTPSLIDIPLDLHQKGELEYSQDAASIISLHFGSQPARAYVAVPNTVNPTEFGDHKVILGSEKDRQSPHALFKQHPWSAQSCALPINKKRTVFWVSKAQFDALSPTQLTISDVDTVTVTMSGAPLDITTYEDLIAPRIEYYLMSIKLLRVIGTCKALEKMKEMCNYFIELEKALYPADSSPTPTPTIHPLPPIGALQPTPITPDKGFVFPPQPDCRAQQQQSGFSASASASASAGTTAATATTTVKAAACNFRERLSNLTKTTKAANCRLAPKLIEIIKMDGPTAPSYRSRGFGGAAGAAAPSASGAAFGGAAPGGGGGFNSEQAAVYLRSTRATNLYSAGPTNNTGGAGGYGMASAAAPIPQQQQQQQQQQSTGFFSSFFSSRSLDGSLPPTAVASTSSISLASSLQAAPQAPQAPQARKMMMTHSYSASPAPASTAVVSFDAIVKRDVNRMAKHLSKLEQSIKDANIEFQLHKSFVSDATTLDGIRAVCTLARTTLQGEDINVLDLGQRESVLDTLGVDEILSYLNIVGVPVQSKIQPYPNCYDYTVDKIFTGYYCSLSDLMVMGSGAQLCVPGLDGDNGRVDNIIPIVENQHIADFLLEHASETLALYSSWGMTRQMSPQWTTIHATLVKALATAVQTATQTTNEANIVLLQQIVNGVGKFDKYAPLQAYSAEVDQANTLVKAFKA